ncbi:MAG: SpoIIE family protein phosphatase [Desulfobacter sp.]|nr:MAG: SpoIIE family protein phosphatase [Desulfobacter sp.]
MKHQGRKLFAEVEYASLCKHGQSCFGDAYRSKRITEKKRLITVLSDGLGSGVKANILSTMTASMAVKLVASDHDVLKSAELIMDALPVCRVREIGYATFSIVDMLLASGTARIVEMDNPAFIFIRGSNVLDLPFETLVSPRWDRRKIRLSHIHIQPEDRIIIMSDGVTQAGTGTREYSGGWKRERCVSFVLEQIRRDPALSARNLSKLVVEEALKKEPGRKAGDDITCGVMYFRKPRKTLILSGPPFDPSRDGSVASKVDAFTGARAICGGTTAAIISRELDRKLTHLPKQAGEELPPISTMEGIQLVTEGILTLSRVAKILKQDVPVTRGGGARRLSDLLIGSDVIHFIVGTRINEAHQDPRMPVELDIRRNVIKKIARTLEEKYLKKVTVEYV